MNDYLIVAIILFSTSLILMIFGVKTYKRLQKLDNSELKKGTNKNLDKSSTGIFFSSLFQSLLEVFKL